MASTLSLLHQALLSGDVSINVGDRGTPLSISVNTPIFHVENFSLADNFTVATLWAQTGGITTYSLGLIISNVAILLELKNDKGSPEFDLINIPANVPIYFGATTRGSTSALLTNNVQTTGIGNVTQIRVQNNQAAASGAATVSMYLFS